MMSAIQERDPNIYFDIYTQVPIWFFQMSIPGKFAYHELKSDIGLVQTSSMTEDLPETIHRLNEMLPFRPELVRSLAQEIQSLGSEIILCDIAPLGIAVARAANLPSILIENFTWDWIYEGYLLDEPRFVPHISYLDTIFRSATWNIRTEPACSYETHADLVTSVASRKPRQSRKTTRERLGISSEKHLVMITMGGIITEYPFLARLEQSEDTLFLVPGGSTEHMRHGSLLLIPHHSDYFHPDLVEASDLVVGKLGYSTLAEAYSSGIPFLYIARPRFREGVPMGQFAQREMGAVELPEDLFFRGDWMDLLPDLLDHSRTKPDAPNGAEQAADFILGLLINP